MPRLCREHYSRPVTGLLLGAGRGGHRGADPAEFVGAAVALYLLFGIPLLPAAVIPAVVSLGILLRVRPSKTGQ